MKIQILNNNQLRKKTEKLLIIQAFFIAISFLVSCDDEISGQPVVSSEVNMDNLVVAPIFNWKNTQDATVVIYTKDNQGKPISNVKVSVWTDFEEDNGVEIINGVTNQQGEFLVDYNFEADIEEIVLKTNFIGFIPEVKVPIENGNIDFTFGGTKSTQNSQNFKENVYSEIESTLKSKLNSTVKIKYIGSYDENGVPDYLVDSDYISAEFLQDLNSALPERDPVPTSHPEYLSVDKEQNLILLDEAQVWVTFVGEGAGYKNVLAYYTYDRDFPPTTTSDITDCTVIFPNASLAGSGGGLYSGDKVYLGVFPENTVIGWVLLRNGWNGSESTVGEGLLYSNLELNPENDINNRQHSVFLLDKERDLIVIGFEDLIRPYGDNDFNDAIFYATANPIENVDTGDIVIFDPNPTDSDGDGVNDSSDDYPDDPNLAFNNYYASKGFYGTLVFEDLWPSKGDFDFNDLVIDYNFNRISNAENEVVTLESKFVVRAIGASYENGFGFTIEGLDPSLIESVSGTSYTEGYIKTNGNGTEAEQSSATVIVFDNAWEHGFANTRQEQAFIVPDTITVSINLTKPIAVNNFGMAPFNPFIIVNKERGKEVHLANYLPSDLVDESYFGQSDDDTQPEIGKYYKTEENIPWAMDFPSKFDYPVETVSMEKAHLHFYDWFLSEGSDYKNWYKDEVGFRNNSNIYKE